MRGHSSSCSILSKFVFFKLYLFVVGFVVVLLLLLVLFVLLVFLLLIHRFELFFKYIF